MAFLGKVWDKDSGTWISPRAAASGQAPYNPTPWSAPNIVAPAPTPAQQSLPTNSTPTNNFGALPFTRTNSTTDPRVLWENGHVAVIFGGDFPAGTGMGRSKTRTSLQDVLNTQIDPVLDSPVGPKSRGDFIKVYLAELLARPAGSTKAHAVPVPRLPTSPDQLRVSPPRIAASGTYKGSVIPDFPHTCGRCGGKYYQGMFNAMHNTPDGRCPAESKKK